MGFDQCILLQLSMGTCWAPFPLPLFVAVWRFILPNVSLPVVHGTFHPFPFMFHFHLPRLSSGPAFVGIPRPGTCRLQRRGVLRTRLWLNLQSWRQPQEGGGRPNRPFWVRICWIGKEQTHHCSVVPISRNATITRTIVTPLAVIWPCMPCHD